MEEKIQIILGRLNRLEHNGVLSMNEEEFHHSSVVSDTLDEKMELIDGEGNMSFFDVLLQAKELFSIYGIPIDAIPTVPFKQVDATYSPILQYTTLIHSDNSNHFSTKQIQVPTSFDSLSPYYLSHEYHHVLKDTNPQEYLYMLRYADVLPQFFELIVGKNPEEEKTLIHNRLALLQSISSSITSYDTSNSIFAIMNSKNCQYLNSFYYSILLYGLYQEHPERVLHKIRQVLTNEITTYQLLEELSLLSSHQDLEVQKGIQYLKKYSSQSM